MSADRVELERHGCVALLTLQGTSPLNPLTDALMDALGSALRQVDADETLHASVIRGSEKAFAAGADIASMATLDAVRAFKLDYIGRNWDVVRQHRKPLIAAVSGYALGGGCELAMMCDIVVAADTAVFGQPEIKLGIVPGAGGTQRLPRAVSKSLAMELCLTGDTISAARALQAGLVSRVVPAGELTSEAMALAERIGAQSLPVAMAIKEAVNRAFESSLQEGLLFERRMFHAGFAAADQKEGMAAFLARRPPHFTNL